MSSSRVIGAIEIGTSKVVVLVAEVIDDTSLNIIARADCPTHGMRKGEIVDFKAVCQCAHAAIHAAEEQAGISLEAVYLAQSGRHLQGCYSVGVTSIQASDQRVTTRDVEKITEQAKGKELGDGRLFIHHIRNSFLLDGQIVENPVGLQGERLEVGYWSISGDERSLHNQIRVINGFGLRVEDMIVSSLASGSLVIGDAEKQAGALVIDIGSGTTDYALFKNGSVVRTGVVSVGGDHISNDLAMGLRVNRKQADFIKKKHGKCLVEKEDKQSTIWLYGDYTIGDRKITQYGIAQIIHARLDELFSIIKKQLGSFGTPAEIPSGVFVTGGSAALPDICKLAQMQFQVPSHLGMPPRWVTEDLRTNDYMTALGLLHYGLTSRESSPAQSSGSGNTLIKKVARILNFNL